MGLAFDREHPEQLLIELVQPRADWFDMNVVAALLPELIRAFEQISLPIDGANEFLNWVSSGAIAVEFQRLAEPRQGIRGLVGEYPQHAGLRALAMGECPDIRLCLAAYVIHTAFEWRAELIPSEQPVYEKRLEGAWRALRLLSDTALARVPKNFSDVDHFTWLFAQVNDGLDRRRYDEQDIRYLDELQRFFKFYVGEGRVVHKKCETGKLEHREIQKVGEWNSLDRDPDSEVGGSPRESVHTTRPENSEQVYKDHFYAGNAPEELSSEFVLLIAEGASFRAERGEAPETALQKGQTKSAAYRRTNSFLPGRWESLNQYERGLVLKVLFDGGWGSAAANVVIALVLLTGRSFESVLRTQVVRDRSQLPDTFVDSDRIYLINEERAWASCVLAPPERRKSKPEWEPYFEVTEKGFMAPIPDAFWQLLRASAETAAKRVKKRSGKLFSINTPKDDLATEIALTLKNLNKASGARVTLKRIENCLFDGMIHKTTDTVDACLVTGRQLPAGQSANLYYHTRAAEVLAADYAHVVNTWLDSLGFASRVMSPARLDFGLPRVGSPFSLRLEVMANVVGRMRAQLHEYRKSIHAPGVIRVFHNLLTAYVHLLVMWATGFRAVRDPIAASYEFNRRRGFVVIADKVDDNLGHSRLVYLPDSVIEQLSRYETHRKEMVRRLQIASVDLTTDTFFFYLNSNLQAVLATPKQLSAEISWIFPWPLNVSRHTLRGYLRDQGVPGYLVDVFMGHWGIGTEPLAKYSSLDLLEWMDEIVPAIAALLDTLGFELEEGVDA
ncbi:hypothetical protein [Marinobacter mobilis]|uniref:hypothetical protein n=1 Tax=Marinobacter mobilis TaxID=488533 RepID=UPI0035C695D1